jgi:hypothetical protein
LVAPMKRISALFLEGTGFLQMIMLVWAFNSGRWIFSIFRCSEKAYLKNGSWYSFNCAIPFELKINQILILL